MTRIIPLTLCLAALALIAPAPALADDAPPTPAQIEAAKKAFAEGKKLHQQGKLPEAIEKFKESYRLSKNPLLLYNIGFTMDEAKESDMALFYYRRFLKEAPPEAEQRAIVVERVKVLEQMFAPTPETPDPARPDPAKPDAPKPDAPKPAPGIKPPGTYSATDFEHQLIDTAPPGKPLDVTASVPDDSGFAVTLYYRTAGEGKFTPRVMKRRYKELVARIPAPKMIGSAVHYYIEVKDAAGAVVTRSGKSTSPNLINIEAGAPARFYPDVTDEPEAPAAAPEVRTRGDNDDDPLSGGAKTAGKKPAAADDAPPLGAAPAPGGGFRDVGSQKFVYAKWGTTIGATAMGGLALVFYIQSGRYKRFAEDDPSACGKPPCQVYDDYAAGLESTGKLYQTLSRVSFGVGVASAAVAGYFWYRDLTAKKRGELKAAGGAARAPAATDWAVAPILPGGPEGFLGATAARRF